MRVLLFVFLLLATLSAGAQTRMDVDCLPGSSAWTLEQVRRSPEQGWLKGSPEHPFAHAPGHEWCRLVASFPGQDGLIVQFTGRTNISLSAPTVYLPSDRGTALDLSRMNREAGNFANRRWPTLRIPEVDEGLPIYLRFEGPQVPYVIRTQAVGLPEFFRHDRQGFAFEIAMISAMAMLGLVAAMFAFKLGRITLLYLCIWVVAVLVLRSVESGVIDNWLPLGRVSRRAGQLAALAAAVASSTVFSAAYLKLRDHYPKWTRLLWWLVGSMVACSVLLNFIYVPVLRVSLNLLILLQFLVVICLAIRLAWSGDSSARFFMVGWSPVLFLSIVRTIAIVMGEHWPMVELLWQFTLLSAVFTLLLATSNAARDAEREMHVARDAAGRDTLTGLANRKVLHETLAGEIDRAHASNTPLSVLYIDIDHFKSINDRHGHDLGDECLKHFARTLQGRVRQSDLLARLGGEEFVVVMPGADISQARQLAEDLRMALASSPLMRHGMAIPMTMSIGVAAAREGDDMQRLLKRADLALYAAKDAGRDRVMLEAVPA